MTHNILFILSISQCILFVKISSQIYPITIARNDPVDLLSPVLAHAQYLRAARGGAPTPIAPDPQLETLRQLSLQDLLEIYHHRVAIHNADSIFAQRARGAIGDDRAFPYISAEPNLPTIVEEPNLLRRSGIRKRAPFYSSKRNMSPVAGLRAPSRPSVPTSVRYGG